MHIATFNILIYNTFNTFNYSDNIYLRIFRNSQFSIYLHIFREFFTISSSIYFTISNQLAYIYSNLYAKSIYHSVKITTSIFAFIFAFDFLFFSFALCDHVFENHFITQNFKTLYSMHLIENVKTLRCNWFIQIKKAQKSYHLRKHELQMKSKIKQKAKKLMKQQKKTRLIKKRTKEFTCKRCKTTKFDNNIKFHEHIRIRHAKKSKFVSSQSIVSSAFESKFFTFSQSIISSSVSSFRSIIFSSFVSSKFLSFSIFASEIVRERSESVSSIFLSIATSRKSIFWAEIVSRSVVASKFSRFSIATFKSMCKFSKNANTFRISASRLYFIVNDLFRMFVEKSNSFDLQRHQMRSFSSRDFDKCNFKNNCDFIQSRITLYFNATISSVSKTIKFETFASIHVSMKYSTRTSFSRTFRFSCSMRSFFSTFSRLFSVCRHCQRRSIIYWFIDWITSNVSKIENNEIFMKMRYWRFALLRSALKKYWFSRNHYFEKVNMLFVCLLLCSFFFSINRWSIMIWKNIKVVVLMRFDVSLLSFCDLKKLYKLLYALFICFIV